MEGEKMVGGGKKREGARNKKCQKRYFSVFIVSMLLIKNA